MGLTIVIPVHNRRELTRACLSSLDRQTVRDFEIVVVDDGSTDGTREMLAQAAPHVRVLEGDGNLLWTGAVNAGVRDVLDRCGEGDLILLLNDDLETPQDYVETLVELSIKYPKTLVGSVAVDIRDRDTIVRGGTVIHWGTAKHQNLNAGEKRSRFPKGFAVDVSTLTGRGTLIPSAVFRKVGLYDQEHFPQCGDIELPVRAAKAGYRLIVSYDAVVLTHVSDTDLNDRQAYRLSDARAYFWDVKSHYSLPNHYWFARTTISNPLRRWRYLVLDVVRIVFHFLRCLRLRLP